MRAKLKWSTNRIIKQSLLLFLVFGLFYVFLVFLPARVFAAAPPSSPVINQEPCKSSTLNKDNCGILSIVVAAIRILSGVVGVVVVVMIALGGIQYALARDNPQAVAAAKSKIVNAILALVFYLMMFGFLQWIVPGGVL